MSDDPVDIANVPEKRERIQLVPMIWRRDGRLTPRSTLT